MGEMDINPVMHRVLEPELARMRDDLKKQWPKEDPELLLLQWLCEKHGLQVPKNKPPPLTVHGLEGLINELTADATSRKKALRAKEGKAEQSAGGQLPDVALVLQASAVQRSRSPPGELPKLPTPRTKLNSQALLDEALQASGVDYARLKTCSATSSSCLVDAELLRRKQAHLRAGDERVLGVVASLRRELRGKLVTRVPLLAAGALTEEDQFWLVGHLRPYNFKPGEVIVKQGEVGDKLFIIEKGACDVIIGDSVKGQIGREEFFGELALMYACLRTATVRAKTEVTVLALSRGDLLATLTPEKVAALAIVARARMFSAIPLLRRLNPKQKEDVTTQLRQEKWLPGTVLARQGHVGVDDQRRIYIVETGQCRKEVVASHILGQDRSEKMGVETLYSGNFFNMFAMYYGCPCTATITAITDVTTLSITYDTLQDIFEADEKRRLEEQRKSKKGNGDELTDAVSTPDIQEAVQKSMRLHLLSMFFNGLDKGGIVPDEKVLALTLEQVDVIAYKRWDRVFEKGSPLNHIHILETGSLVEFDGDAMALRDKDTQAGRGCQEHIMPGQFFGIAALKEGSVAPSSLAATRDSLVLRVHASLVRRATKRSDGRGSTSS